MLVLVIGMLLLVAIGLAVVASVAIPARREGHQVFTPRAGEIVTSVKDNVGDRVPKRAAKLKEQVDQGSPASDPADAPDSANRDEGDPEADERHAP